MTAKKKTLIELMLDSGITPESLDERIECFVSDEPSVVGESWISGYSCIPTFMPKSHEFGAKGYVDCLAKTPYHPAKQGSQVVTKQQFIDAYNERIHSEQVALLREQMPSCSEEIPCSFVDEKSPLDTQIGGDHYTKLAIQPMRYSMENGLDALQHTIIKYVTRFRDKNGIEDLEKAKHCIDMLIEYEKESK